MFVHFKRIEKPVFTDLIPFTFLGVNHDEKHEGADVSIPLTEEEYVKWVMDPSLQYKYNIELVDGKWALTLLSARQTMPDIDLITIKDDDDSQYDVLLVLQQGTEALVHIYNVKMAQDPKIQVVFYGVEADDGMSALFTVKATGPDTFQTVEYDPDNVQVWVREPIVDVRYGVRIIK